MFGRKHKEVSNLWKTCGALIAGMLFEDLSVLLIVLESSNDMGTWADAGDCVTDTEITDDGNGLAETVWVYVEIPPAQIEQRLFLRLMLEQN